MKFGVAGVPTNYKGKFSGLFDWLRGMDLNAYEIQCVYGFKISDVNKDIFRKEKENGFFFSIHAPYFVNLGSQNQDVVARSKASLKDGILLAQSIGVDRIIFHPGGGHENTTEGRELAIRQLIDAINEVTLSIDMKNVRLYPEIGGKTASLGSLDEIIQICKECECCYPCIDIAHLHAREVGSIVNYEVLESRIARIQKELPEKFPYIHFHAYTIQYNDKGEVHHLRHGDNMDDGRPGLPNLDDFARVLHEFNLEPWVISEAMDTQELGAKYILERYKSMV